MNILPNTASGWRPAWMFGLGWLATLLPVWPHQGATFWLWGALAGTVLAATGTLRWRGQSKPSRHDGLALTGCVSLISCAMFIDFWRTPPMLVLAQCRAIADAGVAGNLLHHIKSHWTWFPATSVAMLLWVWLRPLGTRPAAPVPTAPRSRLVNGVLPRAWFGCLLRSPVCVRLAMSFMMTACMGVTMSGFDAASRLLQREMSADGIGSAMVWGMALYHAVPGALSVLGPLVRRAICAAGIAPLRWIFLR